MEIDGESRPWRQGRAHESRACALLGRRSGPLKRITVETIALSDRGVDCYGLFSTVTRLEDNVTAEEGEISCEPTPQKILVAHYRAEPTAQFSMRDDRILIAVKRDDGFEILKVLPI